MSEPHLKFCPFCNGDARIRSMQVGEDCVETWVECRDCFARTDGVEGAYSEPEIAAREWNRRSHA